MTDYEFIKIISDDSRASEHELAFTDFYNRYRDSFYGFMRSKYKGDNDVIYALYDEACLVIKDRRKFDIPEDDVHKFSLKTFLFTVGRNKLIDLIRQNKRNVAFIDNLIYNTDDTDYGVQQYSSEESDENEERFAIIRRAVNAMTEPCNTILTLFYWDNKSGKEIADICGYSNEDSAKTQKSKCMSKLKVYIKNILK